MSRAGGPIDAHAEMDPSTLAVDRVAEQLAAALGAGVQPRRRSGITQCRSKEASTPSVHW